MALFDDRRFLLSHINHSFITGDDTGLCEVVMLDEDVFENQHQRCLQLLGQSADDKDVPLLPQAYDLNYETDLIDTEQGQSYDIISDMDYICHRRRSNTAQRLDRLRKDKLNQSKTKTIVWRLNTNTSNPSEDRLSQDSPTSLNEEKEDKEVGENETDDSTVKRLPQTLPNKSGLTRLMEKYPLQQKNQFDEYAQFDGGMSETVPVKKITIFIYLNDESQAPLEVVIVSSARVQDLIGLVCWQYTNENRQPKLIGHIDDYCLRIAEDNGEVDPDFSSLNPKETLSKFNFPCLALTEKADEKMRPSNSYANNSLYRQQVPVVPRSSNNSSIITSQDKPIMLGKLRAITRIIFRDARL